MTFYKKIVKTIKYLRSEDWVTTKKKITENSVFSIKKLGFFYIKELQSKTAQYFNLIELNQVLVVF